MKFNKIFSMMFVLMLAFFALSFSIFAEEGNAEGSAAEIPANEGPFAEEELPEMAETGKETEEEIVLDVDPGLTPDSPFYFIDKLLENPGDDPEKALKYREEKTAEALVMAREEKTEEAREALDQASSYGEIIEKEVTPDMEAKIKQKAKDMEGALAKISKDLPELEVDKYVQQEERIRLAVEVSLKIKKLCQTLSELDPAQYEGTCKTGDDAPRWQKDMHQLLTDEQKEHARVFASKIRQCFETDGRECDCQDMGVQSFVEGCEWGKSQTIACNEGDEQACRSLQDKEKLFETLPDYLRPVLGELMTGFEEEIGERQGPPSSMETIEGSSFDEKDFLEECRQELSKEKCIEKLKEMKEKVRLPYYKGPPERIVEFGRDCHALSDMAEKSICFEEFYDHARAGFGEDFERKYDGLKEVPPAEHPREWIDSFEEEYSAAGSDSARKNILREIKSEANKRGFIVEQMQGEEGMFSLELVHEDGTDFSYTHKGDFEIAAECQEVGALSPSACRRHLEEFGAWQTAEQEKLERRPVCDDCASQCRGASRTGCVNNQCECYYEVEEGEEENWEEPGEGSREGEEGSWEEPREGSGERPVDEIDYSENRGDSEEDSGESDSSSSSEGSSAASSGGESGETSSDGGSSDSSDSSDSEGNSGSGGDSGESDSGGSEGDSAASSGGSDSGSSQGDSGSSSGGGSGESSGGGSENSVTGAIVYFPSVKKKSNAVTGFFAGILGIE